MSDRVDDLGTVDTKDRRRASQQEREASAVAGAYVLGLLCVAAGAAAIGLSFRDVAFAIGLGLVAPGVMLVIGAAYARRRRR